MVTALVGDEESSRKHLMGLHKMVELRGGVRAFKNNTLIQFQLCRFGIRFCDCRLLTYLRADLTIALLIGGKLMFMPERMSWEPYIAKKELASGESVSGHLLFSDTNLRYIWADLRTWPSKPDRRWTAISTKKSSSHRSIGYCS